MKITLVLLLCVTQILSATTTSNLVAVVQMYRHGLRSPINFYPTDPYSNASYWSVGPGQLDNVGKKQHYTLGRFTRNRYGALLTTQYDSTKFYACTTDVDRTHMSAQANLAALWEPSDTQIWNENLSWQPIPIHPLDPRIFSTACETFAKHYTDVISSAELYADINEEYLETYQILTDNSGYVVSSVAGAASVWDTLWIEDLNGFTLPSWTSSVYPEPLKTLAAYNWMAQTYTTVLKKIRAGLFIRDLIAHFEAIAAGTSTSFYKFKMYSGHDNNMAAVLDVMGVFVPHSPYFASSIYFELRELNGKYFVNVWHKDEDTFQQITVKGCTLNCSLSLFKVLLADYVVNEDEFETICTPSNSSSTSTYALSLSSPSIQRNAEDFMRLHRDLP